MIEAPVARCELNSEQDIVRARQAVRRAAQEAKFSIVDQTKIVTAASELARNTVVHGKGGSMEMSVIRDASRVGIRLKFVDDGAGIEDLDLALRDGWTSVNGLGLGLSGAKRLSDEFHIDSAPGRGTRVTIMRWSSAARA